MGKRLAKRQRHPGWHLALAGLLLAGAIPLLLYAPAPELTSDLPVIAPAPAPVPHQAANASQLADTLYAGIDSALADLGIWPTLYSKRRQKYFDRIEIGVPADLPLAEANLGISRFVQQLGGQILSASERQGQVEIRCGFGEVQTTIFILALVAERRRTGNIAIVLDDFADDDPIAAHFCAIPQTLTFSILPRAGQTPALVERVRANGHEVLVHLPMEPQGEASLGANAILVGLDDEEIRRRVHRALQRVPHARGINNHMGSKATADKRVMRLVLAELKDRNLLFLDSRTTASSVTYQLAVDMDIRAVTRDLFIDETADAQTIQGTLWELAAIAAESGQAIGVGHNRRETLIALVAALPQLERRGFRFIPVSQLLP